MITKSRLKQYATSVAHLNHNFLSHLTITATVLVIHSYNGIHTTSSLQQLSLILLTLLGQLRQPLNLSLLIQLPVRLILSLPRSIINNTGLDDLVSWQPLALTPNCRAALRTEERGYAFAGIGDFVEFFWGALWDVSRCFKSPFVQAIGDELGHVKLLEEDRSYMLGLGSGL